MEYSSAGAAIQTIKYLDGDATEPVFDTDHAIIAHICNDIGVWGGGFVIAVSNKWPEARNKYIEASKKNLMSLGKVQLVKVSEKLYVANMVAQHLIGQDEAGEAPIRYDALITCLRKLRRSIQSFRGSWSIHAPRLGCGLAGGRWEIVEPILSTELCESVIPVTVYDWKG